MALQVRHQLIHRHPIDTRTALILPHALERPCEIAALDDLRHQVVVSRAFVSSRRRSGFTAALACRGFTPIRQREFHLIDRHLVLGLPVTHGRVALLSVWPFALGRSNFPEALRYYGRC